MLHPMTWIDLTSETTLGLPFRARRVVTLTSLSEIESELESLGDGPRLVLGGGSNLVVVEPDFDGSVIRPAVSHWRAEQDGSHIKLTVGAGLDWHTVVMETLEQGWFGLENLALIPGWVGAAPVQNIGAYGVELSDVCTTITVWDFSQQKVSVLPAGGLRFAYRHSILKDLPDRFLVLAVTLQLSTEPETQTEYGAIGEELTQLGLSADNPLDVATAVMSIRSTKLPDPADLANVGSFFKNPIVPKRAVDALRANFPDCPIFPAGSLGHWKLAAGWLIDKAGWKGRAIGNFAVHDDHALVIVNRGGGTAEDLKALVRAIRGDVGDRFSVALEVEPTVIGRFE